MNKHTAGPWQFVDKSDSQKISSYIVESCNLAANGLNANAGAVVKLKKKSYHDNKANAILIAAAPEMLDLLRSFPGFTNDATIGDTWIEKVRQVIAKATGEQNEL